MDGGAVACANDESEDCPACDGWRPINVDHTRKTVCFRVDLIVLAVLISIVVAYALR